MRMICSGCGQPVDLDPPAQPAIVNLVSTSIIVVEHPSKYFAHRVERPSLSAWQMRS